MLAEGNTLVQVEQDYNHLLDMQGYSGLGRAITATLYVSPNGDGTDGSSWSKAYITIQDALDAASTDTDDCTLILISPHTTNYNINRTGDPTWSANVILHGTHRNWAKIKNEHASASSIMKLTGKASVINLNFNLGTDVNGLIMSHGGFRVYRCQFIGEDLEEDKIALEINNSSTLKHGKVVGCGFLGNGKTGNLTAIKLDNAARNIFEDNRLHYSKVGIQIVNEGSDDNLFREIDVGECGIGFDIDAGNEQHLSRIIFHKNTTNIDDEVGDHIYNGIHVETPGVFLPDNFTGIALDTHADPNVWGDNTDILAGASRDKPFKVVSVSVEMDAAEKFRVRLSADGGTSHFDDIQVEGTANVAMRTAVAISTETDYIFNHGTTISGSAKSESGGNTATVWIEIQEI